VRFKTLLYILFGLAGFYALAAIFHQNRALLGAHFFLLPGRAVPLYAVLALAFLAGLVLALMLSVVRESRRFVRRWRDSRSRRAARITDELYGRGVEAMLDGRPGTALEHLRAVLARDPQRADALLKAGEILRGLGRADEAAELHARAHAAAPEDLRPLYELVADAETRGDDTTARQHLERILALKPKGALAAHRRLRDLHIRAQNWDKALEIQERIDRVRPPGNADEARDARMLLGLRYEVGVRLARQGRHREAGTQLRRLLKDAPSFVPAWRMLGEVRRNGGDDEGAVNTWLEGYATTRAPVLLTTLENHFLQRVQPERAIEVFRKAVASSTPDTVPRFYLGKLLTRLEMLDEALHEFLALTDRAAYTPTLSYYIAKIHERRGRFQDANSQYRRIIRDLQLLSTQFHCLTCAREYDEWVERCERCGEWNSVEVDFKEDVSLEDLGISTAPVYSVEGA